MPTPEPKLAPTAENSFYTPPFEIKLGENSSFDDGPPDDVELLRVGTFYHKGEKIDVTREHLNSFIKNFSEQVRGIDLAIDYSHENDGKAAGWITQVYLDGPTKEVLRAKVKWTETGRKMLAEKEFRYVSAEFHMAYRDNETLKAYGPTLLGAGLTNRPVVKHMQPIVQLSESNTGQAMEVVLAKLDQLQKELDAVKMNLQTKENEPEKEEIEMPTELELLQAQLTEMKAQNATLQEKVNTLECDAKKFSEEKAAAAKKDEFDGLLKANKAVEAQREAFMSGDLKKFAELAQEPKTVRLSEGAEGDETENEETVSAKIMKFAEKLVADKKAPDLGAAISAVLADPEHKALSEAYANGVTKL